MFKRHPVPMYGQAVFDAIERAPASLSTAPVLRVRVPPFAAGYADQSPGSVTSIEAITRAALAARSGTGHPSIEVIGATPRSAFMTRGWSSTGRAGPDGDRGIGRYEGAGRTDRFSRHSQVARPAATDRDDAGVGVDAEPVAGLDPFVAVPVPTTAGGRTRARRSPHGT